MTMNPLPPTTPVLIGAGVASQRCEDPGQALEPWRLMEQAVRQAGLDGGSATLASHANAFLFPEGFWAYSNPGRLLAEAFGAQGAHTVLGKIGILQQTLLTRACSAIQQGKWDMAVVVGGEAKYRQLRASQLGITLQDTTQTDAPPDECLTPDQEILLPEELAAGLAMPVGFYAMLENALRAHDGQALAKHQQQLGELYARMSEVAANNPDAWQREALSAEAIRTAGPDNRMLGFPYNKRHNSQWNVDQAGALILCSAAKAEALGIPREHWVFPHAAAESNHMTALSARARLHDCPAMTACFHAACELAGVDAAQLEYIDLYSCFPVAVRLQARALGRSEEAALTVTGGMAFAGGPLNNYVLQSTCKLMALLREHPGSYGMTTSVSGILTKFGAGIWSTTPPRAGFHSADVSREVTAATRLLPVVPPEPGPAVVAGYTVLEGTRAIALCDLPGERRTLASSTEPAVVAAFMSRECTGESVRIDAEGHLHLHH